MAAGSIRICLSLFGTSEQICKAILAARDADLFEIRLDLSAPLDLLRIRSATTRPLIFTAHGKPELLQSAAPFADYLDVEREPPAGPNSIVSVHLKDGDPHELWKEFSGKAITKIVLDTEDYSKIVELLRLDGLHRPNALCFAMGEVGAFSRILSVFRGAPWIYASQPGRATAPGQFSLTQLTDLYRIKRFEAGARLASPATKQVRVFGIVGDPVAHSKSPEFQNRKFSEHSLPWIYLPFPCKDLDALFHYAHEFGVCGFSITHPYKEAVIKHLDVMSDEVRQLRSCNTVCYREGKWHGINTDVVGISALIRKFQVPVSGARVLILGAGGSARAIASLVCKEASELIVLNRTRAKAEAVAQEFHARAGSLDDFPRCSYDVLFQATSVGLRADECPVNPDQLRKGTTVVDVIYEPRETLLLRKARELGCRTVNGEEWFLAQAEAQFQWWRQIL